jgi:hypothetical protein
MEIRTMRTLQNALWSLALVLVVGLSPAPAQAGSPLVGKWKLTVLSGSSEIPVWLLDIKKTDGESSAKVVSAGLEEFDHAKFDKVHLKDKAIHARVLLNGFVLYLSAYRAKDAADDKVLLGSLLVPGGGEAIRLERTELTKLDPKQEPKKGPGGKEMAKLKDSDPLKDRIEILKDVVKKYATDPVAIQANLTLMDYTGDTAPAKELLKLGESAMKVAKKYGPELESAVARDLTGILLRSEKGKELALGFAEKSRQLLNKNVPASDQEHTLKVLINALKEAKKSDEAKLVEKELAQLGPALDLEFKLVAIPFAFEPFKGRNGASKRVAVVELFTGAQCPPCVAADAAFDALLKTYKSTELVLVQYHLHIPGPDALTNADSEARMDFYVDKDKQATPTVLVNGVIPSKVEKKETVTIKLGGAKNMAKKSYETLRELLDKKLEEPASANLTLEAARDKANIKLTAKVGKLPKNAKDLRLRFVIVEDVVHYVGMNKQRLHHHVVRGFAGGVKGIPLAMGKDAYEETVDLKKLKLGLIEYLAETDKTDPFPDDARPLELKHLKVIALIQRDDTKEILNAAQVDVPGK